MAARDLARRSRRQLGWLLAGFALCQVVLAVAIEGWLPQVCDPEHAGKLERLRASRAAAPDRPLVLILGSSRAAFGFEAQYLSAPSPGAHPFAFNFALMGSGPLLELVTLRRLLADGQRPTLLHVEVMPAMLLARGGRRLEERMLDGARLRADEMALLHPHCREPRRVLSGWCLGRALPCYRHQAELRGCLLPDGSANAPPASWAFDGHGWCCRADQPSAGDRRQAAELARVQYGEFCSGSALAAEPVEALHALVTLCQEEGIPVGLVLMPEGQSFRSLYSPLAETAIVCFVERARREWGVAVIDARTWVEEAGFWDGHHLLAPGARRFSERLAREALDPALAALSGPARGETP
ncbi:MAG: hypothetical protein L0Z62_05475 [Gemmataceae bacterium]|nr:hypothetical protein [Gemmataceae bacterium]